MPAYIASGNVVFSSPRAPATVRRALEAQLLAYAGKPVAVVIRTAEQMAEVLANNPFPDAPGNRIVALFLHDAPPPDALDRVSGCVDEELALGSREIYVRYGADMGRSKLKIPAATAGTARNMNTVARLAAMGDALASANRR